MTLLDSTDGPGGRICGHKSGYASLTRIKPGRQRDLRLSVVVQGPSYKWLLKISQISCDKVSDFPMPSSCGISNESGVSNDIVNSNPNFQRVQFTDATVIDSKKLLKTKNVIRMRRKTRLGVGSQKVHKYKQPRIPKTF